MNKAKVEVDNRQARSLLLSECENIQNKVSALRAAIDGIVYYTGIGDAKLGFGEKCGRFHKATDAVYDSIRQLNILVCNLAPLFGDVTKESEE